MGVGEHLRPAGPLQHLQPSLRDRLAASELAVHPEGLATPRANGEAVANGANKGRVWIVWLRAANLTGAVAPRALAAPRSVDPSQGDLACCPIKSRESVCSAPSAKWLSNPSRLRPDANSANDIHRPHHL